jgi:hypothetical protein
MSQLEALALTLAIELAVVAAFAMLLRFWPRSAWPRAFMVAAAASLLSHPWAWWMNTSALVMLPFFERAVVIELAVVAAETMLYALVGGLPLWRALAVAAVANAASFGLGLVIAPLW